MAGVGARLLQCPEGGVQPLSYTRDVRSHGRPISRWIQRLAEKKIRLGLLACLLIAAALVCLVQASPLSGRSKFTLKNWTDLDGASKIGVIQGVIQRAREDRIILRLPAEYYVKEIDSMAARVAEKNDPEGLAAPVGTIIHTLAAMEGDWDNGEDRLEHARKWMGPDDFTFFRQHYPDKYARLGKRPAGRDARDRSVSPPAQDAEPPVK
jgi:hypothetical protein